MVATTISYQINILKPQIMHDKKIIVKLPFKPVATKDLIAMLQNTIMILCRPSLIFTAVNHHFANIANHIA